MYSASILQGTVASSSVPVRYSTAIECLALLCTTLLYCMYTVEGGSGSPTGSDLRPPAPTGGEWAGR